MIKVAAQKPANGAVDSSRMPPVGGDAVTGTAASGLAFTADWRLGCQLWVAFAAGVSFSNISSLLSAWCCHIEKKATCRIVFWHPIVGRVFRYYYVWWSISRSDELIVVVLNNGREYRLRNMASEWQMSKLCSMNVAWNSIFNESTFIASFRHLARR